MDIFNKLRLRIVVHGFVSYRFSKDQLFHGNTYEIQLTLI